MTRGKIYEKLTEIFRDIFDDEELVICDTTTANDIEDWDSIEQVSIIVSTEKEFEIRFDISEVRELKNVGELVDIILGKVTKE